MEFTVILLGEVEHDLLFLLLMVVTTTIPLHQQGQLVQTLLHLLVLVHQLPAVRLVQRVGHLSLEPS